MKKLIRHTRNPKLRKTAQCSDSLVHRSEHKPSQSNNNSSASESESAPESIERAEKRHPIMEFCPVDHKSDLALHVKQLMSDKQISMKNLCKAMYINKQRLHDLFNGKQKTVSKLAAVRIADGLSIPSDSLFTYNHYMPEVKTVVMSDDNEASDKEPLIE